ncbi:EndoU domain-containing protein [Nocardia sp. NPDC006044]|uniref:EndoU domain-containing protein n=1 Tax=Nocardia sp. NPDC006044 TaxID=3364306 RepID=UPI0036A20F33
MGVLVINWETYYDAGKRCHALAADLRTADKPVHDALKGDCAGMAGDTAGCENWGKEYDRAAQVTLQTCTNLADALTNFGNMLYAAGYNWALANKSKPLPDRPNITAMSEYKVSLPTSVGKNGDGITEGNGSIPGFYDALIEKVQDEFGSKLPNGNKDKLAKAASTWKTFAEHATVTGAASRITEISNLFNDIQDRKGLEPLLGHLTTMHGGATQLAAASQSVAAPVGDYSGATSEVRDKFKEAVTNALIAAGATVVIGIAASWITAALSNVAAGAGVLAIAGNTARVLKSTYDISKLVRIIGVGAAAAGATAAAVTAFKDVDLTKEAINLGAIIAMKVFVDEVADGALGSEWGKVQGTVPDGISITQGRRIHILDGDGDEDGGGHAPGVGAPGKTEFPDTDTWTDDHIIDSVLDVARNPDQTPVLQDNGRWKVSGTRDGVLIEVIVNSDGSIRTGYPVSGPGVVRNPFN